MKNAAPAMVLALCLTSTIALAEQVAAVVGNPGSPDKVSRVIEIRLTGDRLMPAEINVMQGETIKFIVTNVDGKKHEMMIASQEELDKHAKMTKEFPDMKHSDEPNLVVIEPGGSKELIWQFPEAGIINFESTLPGHSKVMRGKIRVEAK